MGKRVYALSLVWLTLQSCATSNALKYTAISERNVNNLARIRLGMTDTQILCIMQEPYRLEVFSSSDDEYEVWFYVAQPTVMSQTRMVPFNLHPLIFRNQMLIAMGYDYYYWLKNQSKLYRQYILKTQQEGWIQESLEGEILTEEPLQETSSSHVQEDYNALPEMEEPIDHSSPLGKVPMQIKIPQAASEPTTPATPESSKKTIKITEEDQDMIEDESDQNFNFW